MQLALLANINRDSEKKSEPFSPYDFGLPFLQESEEVDSPKSKAEQEHDLYLYMKAQTLAMGGKVIKK